ncbi:HAD-IC family P-type ATPase [Paenibacillus antibioticophila]|uniref:HAD-IC family P-type ATPase n=1 Tax=Paenibacillus antibioticophila TaxID=1274374 RepID=UPI0005C84C17|nr:HAD-IC family P-type ATPase [Paenibacillus antibioticophila]
MKTQSEHYQTTVEHLASHYEQGNFESGLSHAEARKRLNLYGPNKLVGERVPKWKLFVRQFNNMIIYILIFAAFLTVVMGHISDAIIIGLVVVINALIGYYQEANASDALEKIKGMLSTQATVYRDGARIDIPAEELVVGDVVFLEAGDSVPADLRIVDADNLRIQESALTGEADSVEKVTQELTAENVALADQINMAFASTSVTNGSGLGVVVATAENTEIGKISMEVQGVQERKTPLMKEIDGLGKGVSYVVIGAAVVLFIMGLFMEIYSLSVLSLAVVTMVVGSIPEGLPATTSVILAMGVSDMAKRKHTIVKSLPAVETLGSVDIIATDKTGTLTKNEMTVKDIYIDNYHYEVTGDGYKPEGEIREFGEPVELKPRLRLFLEAGYEANDTLLLHEQDTWSLNGEPTDGAFLTLYHKIFDYRQESQYIELDMLPFDSDYRYMAKLVMHKESRQKLLFIKGSPDKLFPMASKCDEGFDQNKWNRIVRELSLQGKRVVAVGYKHCPDDMEEISHELLHSGIQFLGVAGIIDPPREEVIDALKVMRQAGVEVKMITGDHPLTAKTIGEKLGLADEIQVITGPEWDQLSADEQKEAALKHQVFARTTPKNKLEIVSALQASKKVTAMTGDGVNDAPALKKADIGIAMGIKGTDVAKDSADMILANDNFATMSVAIKEGRRIYDNIKKSILFLLPTSFAEGLIIAFTILMQQSMPLQASQLLWINMVSAITIQFAFIFEPAEEGIMNRPPRRTGGALMSKHDIFQMAYVSVLMAIVSLIAYDWLIYMGADQAIASTMMVNIIVMSKIFYLFNIRTSRLAFSSSFFTNPKAFLIIGIMILLQLILTYAPFMQGAFHTASMTLVEWAIAVLCGLIVLIVAEIDKFIRLRLQARKKGEIRMRQEARQRTVTQSSSE